MANKLVGVAVGLVLVSVGLAGCGSGGSCGNVQPCGGDVVGTWKIVSTCVNQAALNMSLASSGCPTASVTENVDETGTLTFNADMTFSEAVTVSANVTEVIPLSCLGTTTCAQLNSSFQNLSMSDGGVMTSGACSGGATSCNCQLSISGSNLNATGTYSASGNMLTLMPTGGASGTPSGYCVQANMLHVTSTAMMSTGSMSMPIASDVTLQKQ